MTDWTAWHLHLASPARTLADRVVTDVVGPALPPGHPWFFVRYWQGGPHVRLRVGGLGPPAAAALRERLSAGLAAAGRPGPDEPPVDPAEHAVQAAAFAAAERGPDAVPAPLREPGVHAAAYAPEVDRYGGPALMGASEALFERSSALALAALRRPGTSRPALARRAALSAATAVGGPDEQAFYLAFGARAWRELAAAHGYADADLDAAAAAPPAPRPDPDDHGPFRAWRDGLAALAERVRATGAHPGPVVSAHVHMLHNRLGLGPLDELRTYARLAPAGSPA